MRFVALREEHPCHPTPDSSEARVGLPTVLMQSVAQIAPAVGILFTIAFNTQLAGLGAPSTYLVAFVIALVVAVGLGQLAKFLPSAGGFYTYVSTTVGPGCRVHRRLAVLVVCRRHPGRAGRLHRLRAPRRAQAISTASTSRGRCGPWRSCALVAFVGYRGIRMSGKALMIFSMIEMIIIVALVALRADLAGARRDSRWPASTPATAPTSTASTSPSSSRSSPSPAGSRLPPWRRRRAIRAGRSRARWSGRSSCSASFTCSAPGACRSDGAPTI